MGRGGCGLRISEVCAETLKIAAEEIVEGVVFVGHAKEREEAEEDTEELHGGECLGKHEEPDERNEEVAAEVPHKIHDGECLFAQSSQHHEGAGGIHECGNQHPCGVPADADSLDNGESNGVECTKSEAVEHCACVYHLGGLALWFLFWFFLVGVAVAVAVAVAHQSLLSPRRFVTARCALNSVPAAASAFSSASSS